MLSKSQIESSCSVFSDAKMPMSRRECNGCPLNADTDAGEVEHCSASYMCDAGDELCVVRREKRHSENGPTSRRRGNSTAIIGA
jgi:hypothetical protein